jgi:hypothetical protein
VLAFLFRVAHHGLYVFYPPKQIVRQTDLQQRS